MYESALSILKQIHQLGYVGYLIGGYPRDKYQGILNPDIDICTSMPAFLIEQTFTIIENHQEYGSYLIKKDNFLYEITVYRKDIYDKTRYPKITFASTLEEDLQRRDFVINTLCIDKDGNYVDLLNAKKDIDNKMIRMVGNSDKKLKEDPLRIIRAIRFASDLDFQIEESLIYSIQQNKEFLRQLSNTRKQKEITKVKNQEKWNDWIELLDLKTYLS